ncbi:muramidase family protein [Gottschalkia acidurici]|uniref:muramidase family protein n=1 Tax=Clostridium acidurici TaxID=1556 RepID=UPI0002F5A1EE|nr:LysM peptidoglycan-binding domain-containing protein [Gottschalkia acidurici]
MKKLKKIMAGAIIVQTIGMCSISFAGNYKVEPGDSFWKISQKLNIELDQLMQANNAGESTIIYPGQSIQLPDNNSNFKSDTSSQEVKGESTEGNVYSYIVKKGDSLLGISNSEGISLNNLLALNNLNENSMVNPGYELKIDKTYNSSDDKYGEALDWFKEAQYIVPRGAEFKVTDFYTGRSFMLYRSVGTNHADVEALTAQDTAIIKEIWGGNFSWERRPVIVEINGRRIAASLAPMPHAGDDNVPGGQETSWRSGDYGQGVNLDYIKGNDMHGVIDLHFLNSLGHGNPVLNPDHQRCVKIAAGIN